MWSFKFSPCRCGSAVSSRAPTKSTSPAQFVSHRHLHAGFATIASQATKDVTLRSPKVLSAFGAAVGESRFTSPDMGAVMRQPGAHVLAAGVPPACLLPLASATFRLQDGSTFEVNGNNMNLAQRYAPFGWQSIRAWLLQHVQEQHNPPTNDWEVCLCAGSMAGIDAVFRLLIDRGDAVLCEEYTFIASKDLLIAHGAEIIPLAMDEHGLMPSAVEEACEQRAKAGLAMPKVLYIIPVGQNPTGSRLQSERYHAIYEIARRYGFLILEDDAYYYMQHRAAEPEVPLPGLSNLGPSFLSMDVDGRVVRLDTFSKTMAPGFRLAWLTAPKAFVAKFDGLSYFSTQWGSTLSMVLLAKMLERSGWFEIHVQELQSAMRARCQALLAAAEAHLSDIATWRPPQAGMFLWVELKGYRHKASLLDAMKRIGVAVMPGEDSAMGTPPHGSNCIRLSYNVDETVYDEGCRKVARLIAETAPAKSEI